ncbi:hypothetical protein [Lacrimispora sp.]|uniref:hypothetical protein n=1 Tax=Lacrimispora sp. TaxID=2719234 RepID=UPI0028ADEF22|nr:hypothetical protein [Lacrimispora sp.]
MEIRSTMVEELVNCKWLQYCGEQQNVQYDFDVLFQKDHTKAIKTIISTDWENICLEERGNITAYLAINNKKEYNKNWNQLVKKVKLEVLPQIVEKIKEGICIKSLPESIIDDLKFNLITILISDIFSDYYSSEFYHQLYQIYISGHLPCGWDGEFPSGRIIVF